MDERGVISSSYSSSYSSMKIDAVSFPEIILMSSLSLKSLSVSVEQNIIFLL